MIRWIWMAPRWVLIAGVMLLVGVYRLVIRPFLPPTCRFEPG